MRKSYFLIGLLLMAMNTVQAVDQSTVEAAVAGGLVSPSSLPSLKPSVPSSPQEVKPIEIEPGPETETLPESDVFGANLFTGAFARGGASQFNPNYVIATGDQIRLRLWGGYEFDQAITVDPEGNIFVPHLGPVRVRGVRNEDLQDVVNAAVRKIFRKNVYSYASLDEAQPVRIFVSGFVNRPGLYDGTSMDSLLHYLDQAGGIDLERGTFLDIQVKRDGKIRSRVNLYDFLLRGDMPLIQLHDSDVIFVPPRQNVIRVAGLAENAKRFEFSEAAGSIGELVAMAKPLPSATHVRIVRNTGTVRNVDYFPLSELSDINVENGDELEFTADKKPGTITVRVEGEHQSAQEYVLPYGTRLGFLMERIEFSEHSDTPNIQLFRESVKERQQAMLDTALKSLETAALTARSGTSDEARLRTEEANLLLQWVERAKAVEPKGQVIISQSADIDQLLLENGDVINVPVKDGLVLVSGEVLFPNAIAFDEKFRVGDYVASAGGYTQNADVSRVVVARRDGSYAQYEADEVETSSYDTLFADFSSSSTVSVQPGDEILVLPKIDVKSRQVTKDLTQILYQLAVSAKVVLGL